MWKTLKKNRRDLSTTQTDTAHKRRRRVSDDPDRQQVRPAEAARSDGRHGGGDEKSAEAALSGDERQDQTERGGSVL